MSALPSPNQRERDSIVEVGRAFRETIVHAIETGCVDRRSRVLLATLYYTASYSRLVDRVYVAQVAHVAAIPGDRESRHTRRFLHELADAGVLTWEPGRGNRRPGWLGLRQHDPNRPLMAVVGAVDAADTSGQIWTPPGPDLSGEPGRIASATGPDPVVDRAGSGPPTEEVVREVIREVTVEEGPVKPASPTVVNEKAEGLDLDSVADPELRRSLERVQRAIARSAA